MEPKINSHGCLKSDNSFLQRQIAVYSNTGRERCLTIYIDDEENKTGIRQKT